jgi:serine/threonine protein kinase
LASGVITLYQLALIEAGNVDGLMMGPVRVVDRLRASAHETTYRVFDPRRGTDAVLRHLSETDVDAVKPDEFRQRFTQAMLNDVHVANTLEVLDLAGRPAVLQEWLLGLSATDWPPLAAAPGVCYRLLTQAAQGLAVAHHAGAIHGHLSDSLLLLTADGVLKICGLGEPPWLIGVQHDEEPTALDDVRTLGKIVSGWCTPTGVRKGAKTKPLPDALVSILYRMASEGDAGYRDVKELLADLENAAASIPSNTEAWERLVKYVREHGSADVMLRQSA